MQATRVRELGELRTGQVSQEERLSEVVVSLALEQAAVGPCSELSPQGLAHLFARIRELQEIGLVLLHISEDRRHRPEAAGEKCRSLESRLEVRGAQFLGH